MKREEAIEKLHYLINRNRKWENFVREMIKIPFLPFMMERLVGYLVDGEIETILVIFVDDQRPVYLWRRKVIKNFGNFEPQVFQN